MNSFETKSVSFPINENLQSEIDKLAADGWQLTVDPIAVYHFARRIRAAMAPGLGTMVIDDSKVFIRDKDGNERSH